MCLTLLELTSYFLLVIPVFFVHLPYLCFKLSVHITLHLLHVESHVKSRCLVQLVQFLNYLCVVSEFLDDLGCQEVFLFLYGCWLLLDLCRLQNRGLKR